MRKKSVGIVSDHSKTIRQTTYQRGVQRDESPHYVFLYSDEEDDVEREDIPMEPRNRGKAPPRKIEVIKVSLKAEDTLQALALRYRCTISELKRINNIHKENEIYAHRYIKVPVQPYSILTENLIDYEGSSTGKENNSSTEQFSQPSTSRDEQMMNLIATSTVPSTIHQSMGINDIILNSVCEPSPKCTENDSTSIMRDAETDELLLPDEHSSTLQTSAIDTFKCSGADWGLSWAHLVGVSLLLGFAGPLIYIFYIAEESPHRDTH